MILSDIERLSKILNDTEHRAASLRQLSFLFVIVLRLAFTVAAIWFISPLWEPPNCVSLAKTNSMYYTFFRIYDLFSIMWFFVSHALFKYLSCFVYTGWLIKTSQICNDVVLLNNRIQTKANNFFKEQSQLNSVRNYDVVCFYFDSEIHKRVLGVRNVQNNQKVQHVSLHEIDIQSQRLAENVLNRAFILLSNRTKSFFNCAMDFRTVSMVTSFHLFLLASLRSCRFANQSRRPLYTKSCRISQMQYSKGLLENTGEYDAHSSAAMKLAPLLRGIQSHFPDKVDDIQAVRESSTDLDIWSTFVFCGSIKKDISFSTPRNFDAYHQLFRESGSRMVQPLW